MNYRLCALQSYQLASSLFLPLTGGNLRRRSRATWICTRQDRAIISGSVHRKCWESVRYFTDTAVRAVTLAGESLACNFRKQHAHVSGSDILSVGNRLLSSEVTSSNYLQADEQIIGAITEQCPTHNLLTEQTGLIDNGSPYTWIVDPLNGSSNFLNHNPFFAVSVCLAYNNEPVTGVILSPFLQEMVVARKGQGCTLNGRRLTVSATREVSKSYLVACSGEETNNVRFTQMACALHPRVRDFRKIGSAAVESYMVAAGRVDGFASLTISPWDVAAGVLATQEAGGQVSDFNGNCWTIEKTDLLISNGLIHNDILRELDRSGVVSGVVKDVPGMAQAV